MTSRQTVLYDDISRLGHLIVWLICLNQKNFRNLLAMPVGGLKGSQIGSSKGDDYIYGGLYIRSVSQAQSSPCPRVLAANTLTPTQITFHTIGLACFAPGQLQLGQERT
jgi:hypothetical protein